MFGLGRSDAPGERAERAHAADGEREQLIFRKRLDDASREAAVPLPVLEESLGGDKATEILDRVTASLIELPFEFLRRAADDCDEKYHDMGTNDFLLGLMQDHEKMAWMLRAYLEERR